MLLLLWSSLDQLVVRWPKQLAEYAPSAFVLWRLYELASFSDLEFSKVEREQLYAG